VTLDIGGAQVAGVARSEIGEEGVAAIRPDDLVASDQGIPATVEIIEYRGRHFFGQAKGPGGAELYFRAPQRLAAGDAIHLAAPRERVLIYARDAANGGAP
jgi:putative spermidine/putrescine transport system ATP-binding protein